MARFHFHLHECGVVTTDEDGSDLPDLDTARVAAIDAAREIMCGEIRAGRLCLSCCIVIEDANQHEIARVPFRDTIAITGYTEG